MMLTFRLWGRDHDTDARVHVVPEMVTRAIVRIARRADGGNQTVTDLWFTDGAKETVEGDATAYLLGPLANEVSDAR